MEIVTFCKISLRGYERPEISAPVIALLKTQFGPDVDIHLLRHGFGSWSVLRY